MKTFQEIVAAQSQALPDAETTEADTFIETAPTSAVEIEGFVADNDGAVEAKPFVFSSGNKGWRIDCKGKLHGADVRIQANVVIAKNPAERKAAREAKKVARRADKAPSMVGLTPPQVAKLNELLAVPGQDLGSAIKAAKMLA